MTPADGAHQEHLTPERVAAYLDRQLTKAERATVELHLAECRLCREEVVDVARLHRKPPAWRRPRFLVPTAVAATLGALVIGRLAAPGPRDDIVRGEAPAAVSEGVARLGTVAPSATVLVDHDTVQFIWRGAGTEALYRLTLTDPAGNSVWSGVTSDTALLLPDTVELGRDRVYFWYVDALLPDGRSATTGVRRFGTRP